MNTKFKATVLSIVMTGLAVWAGESLGQYAAYPGYPWPNLPNCFNYSEGFKQNHYCARLLPNDCCGTVLQAPTITQLPERRFKTGSGTDCWWGNAKAESEADADSKVQRYDEVYVRLDCDVTYQSKYPTHKCNKGTDLPEDKQFSEIGHLYTVGSTCEYIREDAIDKYRSQSSGGTCVVGAYGYGPPVVCTD